MLYRDEGRITPTGEDWNPMIAIPLDTIDAAVVESLCYLNEKHRDLECCVNEKNKIVGFRVHL